MTIPVQRSGGDSYHTPWVGLLYSAGYGRISRLFIVTIDHVTRDRLRYASPLNWIHIGECIKTDTRSHLVTWNVRLLKRLHFIVGIVYRAYTNCVGKSSWCLGGEYLCWGFRPGTIQLRRRMMAVAIVSATDIQVNAKLHTG